MPGQYAQGTQVSADRSKAEIEKTLTRYGADQFIYGWSGRDILIAFRAHGRQIRFVLPQPDVDDYRRTPTGRARSTDQIKMELEKAQRQIWRSMLLVIKAKLEAVATGLVTFEEEFLAYIALPNGTTVGDWAEEQIKHIYETGQMPELLPATRKEIAR